MNVLGLSTSPANREAGEPVCSAPGSTGPRCAGRRGVHGRDLYSVARRSRAGSNHPAAH